MELQTKIDVQRSQWHIEPHHKLLFVGSCFADNIGQRFKENAFHCVVNPQGVMYNPASVLQCISSQEHADIVFITLGTNHIYRLKETGEIVANCQKRPASLFSEEELTIDECVDYLQRAVDLLLANNSTIKIVLTVSPIRYAKYGFHTSQLSKSILLLAADRVVKANECCTYFPAYEIMNDELRDYRFYNPDMIHPSAQAVDYIWERLDFAFFSDATRRYIEEWKPIRAALNHKPFNPDSEEYRQFLQQTKEKELNFYKKYDIQHC